MATTKKVKIKLLVDKNANRVLFAEAGKDFVDYLFGLLTLPLGTVINLLTKQRMVGSFGNLYGSVENLSSTYMQPNQNKDTLLKPKPSFCSGNIPLLPPMSSDTVNQKPSSSAFGSSTSNLFGAQAAFGSSTSNLFGAQAPIYVKPSSIEEGYVKDVVTYMVTDNLEVNPMSTISTITHLNRLNIGNISCLEEQLVDLTMKEGLELLRASLSSTTVLTDVFLERRRESHQMLE